jgi:hypothetical protein
MIRITTVLFIGFLGVLITNSNIKNPNMKESTVFFSSQSYLKIKGKTNVSTFECEFNMDVLSDSMTVSYFDHDNHLKFNKASLTLPNLEFSCGGKAIDKDFNKLLNTDKFPEIVLILKEITPNDASSSVNATVDIMICNVVNTYTVPVSVSSSDQIQIDGRLPLNIKDFNLTAPSKVMGLIKVNPEIEIEFSLNVLKC